MAITGAEIPIMLSVMENMAYEMAIMVAEIEKMAEGEALSGAFKGFWASKWVYISLKSKGGFVSLVVFLVFFVKRFVPFVVENEPRRTQRKKHKDSQRFFVIKY